MTREEAIKAVGLELVEEAERVEVYYYQPNEVLKKMAADGDTDLGGLDWEIDHYEIIG